MSSNAPGVNFSPNFLQPFLETSDRRSCNDGSRELIPVKPSQKKPTFSFGVVSYLGISCRSVLIGRVERGKAKTVRIKNKEAHEYLEGGNWVSPKSSPLQGMKAQSLQSLPVGKVMHASYQPNSQLLNSL